jgi:hypothetical protein
MAHKRLNSAGVIPDRRRSKAAGVDFPVAAFYDRIHPERGCAAEVIGPT